MLDHLNYVTVAVNYGLFWQMANYGTRYCFFCTVPPQLRTGLVYVWQAAVVALRCRPHNPITLCKTGQRASLLVLSCFYLNMDK